MTNEQSVFVFDNSMVPSQSALRVLVPRHIENKQTLLTELSELLNFPKYFGENWDAFEECIRDLSWMQPGSVILVHSDLPLANDPSNAKIYLSIMRDAVRKVSNSHNRALIIFFPKECKQQIEHLLLAQ